MLSFPPVLPDPSWRFSVRLGWDHYVRVETCDYSIDPRAIGRRIEVLVDARRVTTRLGTEVVGDHARSYARHRSVTDPRHVRLREQLRHRVPTMCDEDVEVSDLSVYDRIGAA